MNYLIGHQIEHYRLEAVLGDGGMGTVYRAYDLQSDRLVAVKMMSSHLAQKPAFQRRFAQEAQATQTFNSPHIVKVYRSGEYQGVPYMVMEYIPGGSLTDYLRQLKWAGRQISLDEAIALAAQVAEGLSYAHQRGLIHRDIKPDNILLRQPGGSSGPKQAVITDFGLAVLLKEGEEVSTNPFMGSLPYMSPEQCSNLPLDGRSDLYSLGVMLYQLTTGQLPFRIEAPADIIKHLQETPLPPRLVNPHLPQVIEDVTLKMLAKKPGDRFQTGAEIAHKLRSIDLRVEGAARTAVSADSAVTQWIENRWIAGVDVQNRVDVNRTWTSPGDYRLFITHQWEEPRIAALSGGIVTIGRHPDNTIVLNDRSVSVHHARLENTASGWRVVDLGSTNGTTLDERKLEYNQPEEWASHQTLRIGQYALQWQAFASHAQSKGTAVSPAPPLVAAALLTTAPPPAAPPPTPPAANGHSKPQAAPAPALAAVGAAATLAQAAEWDDPDLIMAQPGQTLELTLNPATLEISPGAVAQLQLRVLNLGATVEDISLYALEHGQVPHWISWRDNQIKLLPGESETLTLDVAPPQDSAVLAGSHVIELRAATSRGVTETTSGVINVARWEEFSLDMHPRNLQEKINCRLTITDQGNFANVYQLEGVDDDEQLIFAFSPPQNATLVDDAPNQQRIRIQPGNTSVLTFTIQPKKRPWFRAPSRPFPFRIRTRTETSDWRVLDGQVSILPRFSMRFLLFVLLLFLLMLLLGFAIVSRVRANAAQREMEMRDSFSATATAVRATLDVFESAVDSAQATADALRAAGDLAGADAAQATADALRATLAAQNLQLDQVSAQLQITPTPVPVPVDITLDNLSVPENAPIGTTVGTFSATLNEEGGSSSVPAASTPIAQSTPKPNIQARLLQQQSGPRIIYSLVSGSGDRDNASFFIEGAALKTARRFDFETQSSYSVRVRADNGAGGIFERSFTIAVVDLNDTPAFSVSDVTVDEGAGRAIIAIVMTNDSNSVVSVDVSTADGTARQGEDYTAFEGTVRWQPGETGRKTIEIPIIDDNVDEPDETFTVRLSNPVIGVINTGTATVTILDNDDPPTLSIADLTVSEGAGQAVLVVTMTGLSSREVSVSYATADGTARANEDYTAASGTLVWRAGETGPKNLSVTILDDQIFEANETFTVNLSSASNATLDRSTATVTIEENDPAPVVSIVQTLTVDEPTDADGNAFLTATIDRASSVNVTVNYATSDDTAVKGRDYVETNGTITWQAGETGVKSIPVIIKADRINEPDETFLVTLSNPVNATLGNAVARVTISDSDDLPNVQVLGDVTVTEGPQVRARVQVRLNGGSSTPVSVGYVTENGTAIADQDFRPTAANATLTWNAEEADTVKEIFIDILDDRIDEPDETFSVILNSVPTNNAALATQNRAIITIQDNDPPPTLQLRTTSVDEGSGQPPIEVRLFGGSHQDVEVSVAVTDGTAVSGQDYIFTSVPPLVFPANEVDRVLTFPIRILDDQIFEPGEGETINVALTPNPDTGVAPLTGVIRITDNDVAPTLRITNSSLEIIEGTGPNPTTLTVTVMLERGINRAVTAVVNTEDITAQANVDYIPISNLALTFPANAINTTRSFPVRIVADAVDEANEERFRVRITTPDDPDVGDTSGVITILDDDVAGLAVEPLTLETAEGDPAGVAYSVRLTSAPTSTVTITVDPEDQVQLIGPSQLLAPPGAPIELTFAANNSALAPQVVTVIAVDDSLVEGPHTALITHLSRSTDPLYNGRSQSVTVNIADNDLPPVITPGQSREVSEIAPADTPLGAVISGTVRSTGGSLQDWTIVSVTPITATGYFAIDGNGQIRLTAVGAGNLDREGPVISYTLALTVSDGFSVSDPPENVVINVLDANDEIPVIPPQSRDVPENMDPPGPFGAPLTATDPDVTPTIFQDWSILSVSPADARNYFTLNPDTGQLGLTAVGAANIDFETEPDFYLLEVTVSDGVNTSAPQTITVNVIDTNDPPVGVDDAYNATEDVTLLVPAPGVLANDTDIDAAGDILTVVAVNGSPSVGQAILLDSGALLQMFADGRFTYNTNGGYDHLAAGQIGTDSFIYTVGDGNGGEDTATVTITITGVNDNPRAVPDSGATLQDQILVVAPRGVLENDTDPDSPPANFVVIAVNGGAANVGNQISLSSGALLTLNANGGYTYNPNGAFTSLPVGQTTTDNFTYTLSDGDGGSDIGTVTITITGVNDPPTAVNDSATTNEDTILNVPAPGVLGNDTDPDGDTLTVTAVEGSAEDVGTQIELYPSGALLTLNANGSYSYNPNGQFNYLAVGQTATDSFSYTIGDGNGGSDSATVTITITGVNDPPTAVDDSNATLQNVILTVPAPGVLANDTDPDNGDQANLTVTAVNGSAANVGTQIATAKNGLIALNADGSYIYNPNGAFDHLPQGATDTDSFTYTVSDGNGGSDVGTVTITITGVNDAPILSSISASRTYTEGMNLVILAPNALVSDIDNPPNINGTLVVEIISGGTATDRLGIDASSLPSGYSINTGQKEVRRNPNIAIATYNENPAIWPMALSITFTANATQADIQVVLRAIYFNNTINTPGGPPNPDVTPREIRFTLTDTLGAASNQPIVQVNVIAVYHDAGRSVTQAPGGAADKTFIMALIIRYDDPTPS